MAIRVERNISNNECDGQKNRIAASSAKCKENMAGWTFYQGQAAAMTKLGVMNLSKAICTINIDLVQALAKCN